MTGVTEKSFACQMCMCLFWPLRAFPGSQPHWGMTYTSLARAGVRKAPDTFNFLRHVMRAIWSVRPKCSHRCVSMKETPLKPVQSLKHTTENSAEQTVMRTKWFKHIAT